MIDDDGIKDLISLAEQGDCQAQNDLAASYATGDGIAKDLKKAIYWYEKAAAQESGNAVYNLAFMHLLGEGVDKDEKKATEMFFFAAEQLGNCDAQLVIAEAYENGHLNLPADYEKAAAFYLKAAQRGAVKAIRQLGELMASGHISAETLSDQMRNFKL